MHRLPFKTRRLLKVANWDRLWRQCLLYAAYQERKYFGLQHHSRDIVQSAIEKTLSGERTWDPQVCDLLHHLKMTISSLYSSAYGRRQTQLRYALLSRADTNETASPAKVQENLDFLRRAVGRLRQHDPALAEFFILACHHLTTDCDTAKEAAAAMNLTPSAFTKTKARISQIIGSWETRSEKGLRK